MSEPMSTEALDRGGVFGMLGGISWGAAAGVVHLDGSISYVHVAGLAGAVAGLFVLTGSSEEKTVDTWTRRTFGLLLRGAFLIVLAGGAVAVSGRVMT